MKWAISEQELQKRLAASAGSGVSPHTAGKGQLIQFQALKNNPSVLVPKGGNPDIEASFKVYKDQDSLEKALTNAEEFIAWVTHPLPKAYGYEAQERYELFCGGWLQFYDLHTMQGSTDHVISFDWSKTGFVSIKISPSPKDKAWNVFVRVEPPGFSDPPKPPPPPPPYS